MAFAMNAVYLTVRNAVMETTKSAVTASTLITLWTVSVCLVISLIASYAVLTILLNAANARQEALYPKVSALHA